MLEIEQGFFSKNNFHMLLSIFYLLYHGPKCRVCFDLTCTVLVVLEERAGVLFSSLFPWVPLSSQSQRLFLPEMNGRKHKGIGDGTFHFIHVPARTLCFCSVRTSNGDRVMLDEHLLDSGNRVKQ